MKHLDLVGISTNRLIVMHLEGLTNRLLGVHIEQVWCDKLVATEVLCTTSREAIPAPPPRPQGPTGNGPDRELSIEGARKSRDAATVHVMLWSHELATFLRTLARAPI
jgi:hypothetical protein